MKTLTRTAFTTDRTMEFFTESEFTTQLGSGRDLWPLAITKELVDNALDDAEGNGGAPVISVTLEPDAIIVTDNGTGIPGEVIERLLDYRVRVSDKKNYVAPTRGQLGNALKCVVAVAFVATGTGLVEIVTRGLVHRIGVSLDRIAQKPVINHTTKPAAVKKGTSVRLHWKGVASYKTRWGEPNFYQPAVDLSVALQRLMDDFAALNPHASFEFNGSHIRASDPSWSKWAADNPTSAHWYRAEHLRGLIAADIAEADRPVREFLAEFAGLSGTQVRKAVLAVARIPAGNRLSDLVVKGDIDMAAVERLLKAMRDVSRPIEPKRLGIIGKQHLEASFKRMRAKGFHYQKSAFLDDEGLPCVVEVAFGMRSDGVERRRLILGINWSPIFKVPSGAINDALSNCRVQYSDPVILAIHMARPRFAFTDHGKGAIGE